MNYDEKEQDVTTETDDHDQIVLSLEETEPIELEEVETPPSYFLQAARHMNAKFTSFRPRPDKGEGGG